MMTQTELDAARRELEELADDVADKQRAARRRASLRAGIVSMMALSAAGMGGSYAGYADRVVRLMYRRAAHPRDGAFRVGSWAGDGTPSRMGTAGITRQMRRRAARI